MKMKSRRKAERDQAKRDPRARLRESSAATDDTTRDEADDLDLEVARSLMGYDA